MKKSYLNRVITMTLSCAVLSTAIVAPGVMAGAYENTSSDTSIQDKLNTSSIETALTDTIQIDSDPIAALEPALDDHPSDKAVSSPDIVSITTDTSP